MLKIAEAGIMQSLFPLRFHERSLVAVILLLACGGPAWADVYNSSNMELAIPRVMIGNATYFNMAVTVGSIVGGPTGAPRNGAVDSYDPANGQLTAPVVEVVDTIYYNLVGTVSDLVSVSTVSNADVYDGAILTIPSVQVLNGALYSNVAISIGTVIKVRGGMPANSQDVYDPASKQLTIAAVQYGSQVYTNVVVTIGNFVSVGKGNGSLSLSPSVLPLRCTFRFGFANDCSQGVPVDLTNNGNAPVYVFGATISGNGDFSVSSSCPNVLAPGQSCALFVSMEYFSSEGCARNNEMQTLCTGVLFVNDSASDGPQTVKLEGLVIVEP